MSIINGFFLSAGLAGLVGFGATCNSATNVYMYKRGAQHLANDLYGTNVVYTKHGYPILRDSEGKILNANRNEQYEKKRDGVLYLLVNSSFLTIGGFGLFVATCGFRPRRGLLTEEDFKNVIDDRKEI